MSRYAAEEGRLVYVGNLPDDVRERDIDELFHKFGRIENVDIKIGSRPPPFAFVQFSNRRCV
jgi:arginine/serine-rich splicing factor 1/9